MSKMDLPSTVHGTPHAVFDSTGMVFGVTAAMTSGNDGHVSLELFYCNIFFVAASHIFSSFILSHYSISTSMMFEIILVVHLQKSNVLKTQLKRQSKLTLVHHQNAREN